MSFPKTVSFRVICPQLGKVSDTEFATNQSLSTVVSCLKEVFDLEDDDYYLKHHGAHLSHYQTVGATIVNGTTCLLLRGEATNLDRNLDLALLHCPEAFVNNMKKAIISVMVNGHEMRGFLDSGAMHSILTMENAISCNLESLIDPRFCDTAAGVGGEDVSRGKIFYCPLTVATVHTPISLLIINGSSTLFERGEVLLGKDFIQKHIRTIDFDEGKVYFKNGSVVNCLN